ncbi:MAG: LysM peptidoglycan-binding domain-containing protein [Planctomycetota bacterium]
MAGGSTNTTRRAAVGLLALAALWNVAYWAWPAHRESPVVLASAPPEADPEPAVASEIPPATLTAEPPISADLPAVDTPPDEPRLVPPEFDEHVVTERDRTLGDLARRYYGNSALWEPIARANPLKDPNRVQAGQVWRVPRDPGNIQGRVLDAAGDPLPPAPAARPEPVAYVEYRVRPKDSLSKISQDQYGTTRHARFLYEFNRRRLGLRSIDAIREGQVLHIPPKPE